MYSCTLSGRSASAKALLCWHCQAAAAAKPSMAGHACHSCELLVPPARQACCLSVACCPAAFITPPATQRVSNCARLAQDWRHLRCLRVTQRGSLRSMDDCQLVRSRRINDTIHEAWSAWDQNLCKQTTRGDEPDEYVTFFASMRAGPCKE